MKLQQRDGEWPALIAPPGATVTKAMIIGPNGDIHLVLRDSVRHWNGEIIIPAPWTFTSCLLALSSDQLESSQNDPIPAADLFGLEGASLSTIERGHDRIDLVFDSIRLSVSAR